jgi:putative DNA primase/helicase
MNIPPDDKDNAMTATLAAMAPPVAPPCGGGPATSPPPLALTELGLAERFIRDHGRELCYATDAVEWIVWDAKRWAVDVGHTRVRRRMLDTVRRIHAEATNEQPRARYAEILDFAEDCECDRVVAAALRLATALADPRRLSDFDQRADILNCENGVVDLRSGQLLPHDPTFLMTKMSPVRFDPAARSTGFDSVLAHIVHADAEFATHLQKLVGYLITGSTAEKKVFVISSRMANTCKSTFVRGLRTILGDFGIAMDLETLTVERGISKPRYDLAKLRGMRLVEVAEASEERLLSTELLKRLSGGDPVRARDIFEKSIEFLPTHKIVIHTNDPPALADPTDPVARSRLHIVPFDNPVSEAVRDERVKEVLGDPNSDETRALFAWAVGGAVLWHTQKLGKCARASDRTAQFNEESDPLADFVQTRLELVQDGEILARDMETAVTKWALDTGTPPLRPQERAKLLRRHGLLDARAAGGVRVWRGGRLRE